MGWQEAGKRGVQVSLSAEGDISPRGHPAVLGMWALIVVQLARHDPWIEAFGELSPGI
jgi:hypothetical protein